MLVSGDSTLIISPKGKTILIDGGDAEKNILIPYLLARKIKTIDYLIISHFDLDHVGGVLEVMEALKVKNAIISNQVEKTDNFEEFLKIAKNKKTKVICIGTNNTSGMEKVSIEKNFYFDILWPNNKNTVLGNALNNNSIVCKLTYNNFSMLFTGDIEEEAEKEILEQYKTYLNVLNSTILKVAHHGSKTSSTEEFIKAVNPKIVLIGVGLNNKFGHPDEDVLKRIESVRCKNL